MKNKVEEKSVKFKELLENANLTASLAQQLSTNHVFAKVFVGVTKEISNLVDEKHFEKIDDSGKEFIKQVTSLGVKDLDPKKELRGIKLQMAIFAMLILMENAGVIVIKNPDPFKIMKEMKDAMKNIKDLKKDNKGKNK